MIFSLRGPLRSASFGAVTIALVGLLGQSHAADHPRLSPSRDATVMYHLTTGGRNAQPEDVKAYFSGSGDLLRIDSGDGRAVTILDRPTQRVTLVMLPQHVYTQFSPRHGLRNPFLLDLSMHYTPAGSGKIAGLACTKWNIESDHGKAKACVTDDGLILSESGVDSDGMEGVLEAKSVSYADIPAATFQPPEGFERISAHHRLRPLNGGAPTAPIAPPGAADPSTIVPNSLPGAASARAPQDVTEPPLSDDSSGDGSVTLPDQPPSGPVAPQPPQR